MLKQNRMKKDSSKYLMYNNPGVVMFFLLVPAVLIRYFLANAQIIAPDGVLYIEVAKGISLGNFQSISNYSFINLYSFLIALFQTFLHDWEFSGKMVSVVFGSLTIVPLFFLIRGLFNQNIATVSTLFYTVHPRFAEYSSDIIREPVFWFFSIFALCLAWEGISRKKYFPFILASLATGFAMFTRVEGALVFLIIVLWILRVVLKDKKSKQKGFLYACIFLFSFPVLLSPGLILLKNRLNRWESGPSISKITDLMKNNDLPSALKRELPREASYKLQAFLDVSTRHWYASCFMEVVYKFFKSFNAVLFLLFLCGLYRRRFVPYSEKETMFIIWFSVAFLGCFLYLSKTYYLGTRHGLLMVFPALAWAGAGFFEIRERIRERFGGMKLFQRYGRFDTLVLITLLLIVLVPQTVFSYRYDKVELKKAGIALKNMGLSNTAFIVQPTLDRVAFYADADFVQLPNTIDSGAMKLLITQHNAKRLIIDERTIDDYVPGIRKIIEQSKFEKLTVPEMDQYREYSFSIYKIGEKY